MSEIQNAKITGTQLGTEDHGIFTCMIYVDYGGSGQGFGGYGLDEYIEGLKRRVDFTGIGIEYVKKILDVVGVDNWEDLKGKYVKVEQDGYGGKILGIGNILDDTKWFYPSQFFLEHEARYE